MQTLYFLASSDVSFIKSVAPPVLLSMTSPAQMKAKSKSTLPDGGIVSLNLSGYLTIGRGKTTNEFSGFGEVR